MSCGGVLRRLALRRPLALAVRQQVRPGLLMPSRSIFGRGGVMLPLRQLSSSTILESEPVGDESDDMDAEFQVAIGQIENGNEKEGTWTLKQLADRGHAQSLCQLGLFYSSGTGGLKQDPSKAYHNYKKAADLHHPVALRQVADALIRGEGVEANVYKSVPYLERAAELGEGSAQTLLGIFYYSGVAGERDLYRASELMLKGLSNPTTTSAAKEDAGKALFVICTQFLDGGDLARKDEKQAFELLSSLLPHAGDSYKPFVLYLLAQCYGEGRGVEEDMEQATVYLEQSAELGCEDAMAMIAKFNSTADD